MSVNRRISRRRFLKTAAAAAAAPYVITSEALGGPNKAPASERITLAHVGIGNIGRPHFGALANGRDTQAVAVCDVRKSVRDKYGGKGRRAYNEYEAAIARDDVDAVVIATPDHWHAIIAVAAAKAGKDVFCEKPLSLTIREARAMVDAARRYGRVFQTGSQQRSAGNFRTACELVRSGYIGELKEVHAGVGGPSAEKEFPPEPVPAGFDWDRWLGPAPAKPYNAERCSGDYGGGWRRVRDYSGGMMTDWGAHHFDIAQWGMGMDASGPVEILPPDGKQVKHLTYRYANGVLLKRTGGGVNFIGTKGRIHVDRGRLDSDPPGIIRIPIKPGDVHLYRSPGHHADWINCIRTRRRPICDVEIGCRSVTVCHLGNIACWLGRPIRWDPVTEEIIGDEQASRWLDRPKRAPWRIE